MRSLLPHPFASLFVSAFMACSSTEPSVATVGPGETPDADAGLEPDAAPASSAECVAQAERLQAALDASRGKSTGAALAVSTPECGRWIGVSGQATKREPLATDDVWRIGSTTKTYVAATALSLVEDGIVSLDDTVERWLPAAVPGGASITVRQLLNHTSGLAEYVTLSTFRTQLQAEPLRRWAPAELVALAVAAAPTGAPGARWAYTNTGYVLLGMLLEVASGRPLAELVRERTYGKLALELTSFAGADPLRGRLAHGYSATGADYTSELDPSAFWSAGAMVASLGDVVAWSDALYGSDRVLNASSRAAMVEQAVATGEKGIGYGLGVIVISAPLLDGDSGLGHGGDIPGYHSQLFYVPSRRLSLAAIVNRDGVDVNELVVAAFAAL